MAEAQSSDPQRVATVIVSSTLLLPLSSMAAFGDAVDIFTNERIESRGGTINFTIDVRRTFLKGNYVLHVVKTELDKHVAIVCLESVNPLKVHQVLRRSDMGANFRLSNYMNRYDWMHFRNWQDRPDERESRAFLKFMKNRFGKDTFRYLAFFVDANCVPALAALDFLIEEENGWIYTIRDKAARRPIGFAVHSRMFAGEWCYGCVLVEKSANECFAFVLGDAYTTFEQDNPDSSLIKQDVVNYTFPLNDFL